MKYSLVSYLDDYGCVALYMSAWIEIATKEHCFTIPAVALYMSAWIEIFPFMITVGMAKVALYMSAWIEITET